MSVPEAETRDTQTMPNYNRAEEAAQRVLADAGVTSAPINPIAVATILGYSVFPARFRDPSMSGRILFKDGQVRIDVNAYDVPNRRRFTIAHEIGHAQLHLEGFSNMEITDRVGETAEMARQTHEGLRPAREVEADRFAAALLMPKEWVVNQFQNDRNPKALAQFFKVSEAAMLIRLKQLGLAA